MKVEIAYPFHFRYQPAREKVATTKVAYPGPPNVYLDCKSTPLKHYSKKQHDHYPPFKNILTTENAPAFIHGMIPNGVKEELPSIQLYTFGSTLAGFFILAIAIVRKSSEKIKAEKSD